MAVLTATPAISVKNASKSFAGKPAVSGLDLEVQKGEIFGFLGPNGAGKSTTIRLLLDILRPDSGSIQLLGRSNRETAVLHREIGFLSGDMAMDLDLTGRQYLQFINSLHGGRFDHATQRLSELLDADVDKKISEYSRGNRQKIGLIASLLHHPKLLILDEPTSGFDPLIQERFAEIIREYVATGGTVFMSSHILAEVQHLCDRVAFIKEGRIITTTSVKELLDSNAKRVEVMAPASILRSIQKDTSELKGLNLVESHEQRAVFSYSGAIRPLLAYFADKRLTDIVIREPELEEIFGHYYEDPIRNQKEVGSDA
jgi:ABC-2 type transport system ATP-binding protein